MINVTRVPASTMRPTFLLAAGLLASLVLLTGCAKKFVGDYERVPDAPAPASPAVRDSASPTGPELQAMMQRKVASFQRSALGVGEDIQRLSFDGSHVKILGTDGRQATGTYEFAPDSIKISLDSDSAPSASQLLLTIAPDGALDGPGIRFVPVQTR